MKDGKASVKEYREEEVIKDKLLEVVEECPVSAIRYE